MSITPRGMSIQEAYRNFSDDKFLVNRRYQRKLVWTVSEKQFLIDSIKKGLPIPLILLAQTTDGKYEIIDGLQRLNAIFSFIENRFEITEKYFDVNQFSRAKQLGDAGGFNYETDPQKLLSPAICANILDYQLAVTIYPSSEEDEVTDIFGRINSGGKQLSPQEKRQAGMLDNFSEIVRVIASEIRGDSSQDLVDLSDMPEISIDSNRENIGYGLKADDIFWCSHGILWKSQLRDSEDEEMVSDILASIILNEPIARSKELFDEIYESKGDLNNDLNAKLKSYGEDRLKHEVSVTLSIIRDVFEKEKTTIRGVVNPKSRNPVKGSFFAIFMSFFNLVVEEEKSPAQYDEIVAAISGLQKEMIASAKFSKTEDRIKNVNKTTGLIQPYFVKKDPPVLRHGAGLSLDFENSIRRSKVESNRYECKQGICELANSRNVNNDIFNKIVSTICGIANLGPDSDGFLFIGVADKKKDSERINQLDGIDPIEINNRYVVGIDRELILTKKSIDDYVKLIISQIKSSDLSEPLKSQTLSQIDVVDYRGFTVIRIRVPVQKELSFVGKDCYVRENSETILIEGPKILALSKLFS
jgi:hypothetical protein